MTTTGSFTFMNGSDSYTLYWEMVLTETAVDYNNNTSTVSYSFKIKPGSSGFTTANSNWLRLGINTVGNIYDCSYDQYGNQSASKWTDGYYFNSNYTRKFLAQCNDTSTYKTLKYVDKGAGTSTTTYYGETAGSFTVPHNSDGTGTAKLIVWWGRNATSLYGYFSDKKLESNVLTLTSTGGTAYIWNGSSWQKATPYVWNGSQWKVATPYIWNGSSWEITRG